MSSLEDCHADDIPDFIEIEENDFGKYESSLGVAGLPNKGKLREEVFPCECKWPHNWKDDAPMERRKTVACGSHANCINRTLFVECRPQDCPCGVHCQNQRFQRKEYKPIRVFKTPGKGHGLRCLVDIYPGDFIIEYVGEVVSQSQMQKRLEINAQLGQQHYYFMTLQSDQILDATRKGNHSRFMNHSCNPNCATQKWIINGQVRIGLFALKTIPAGTELTFDYKFVRFSSEAQKCLCGEQNCKGFIGTERKDAELFDTDDEDEEGGDFSKKPTGIDDPEIMAALAKVLLRKDNVKDLTPALETLHNTTSATCLKKFVSLHGLQILQILLGQHKRDQGLVKLILQILKILPVGSKNVLNDSKIEPVIDALAAGDSDEEIKCICSDLKKSWSSLEHSFTIPKASSFTDKDTLLIQGSARSLTPSSVDSTAGSTGSAGYSLDDGKAFKKAPKWNSSASATETEKNRSEYRPRESAGNYDRSRNRDSRDPQRDYQPRNNDRSRDYERRDERRRDISVVPSRRPADRETSPRKRPVTEKLQLESGWREAKTADGKSYYYHEKSRETRWDPPYEKKPSSDTIESSKLNPSTLVEGLHGKDIEAVIARAKAAALNKANSSPAEVESPIENPSSLPKSPTENPVIRDKVSAVVVGFLSRYKDQFKDQSAFKEMARKLTHGLAEKELRNLIVSGISPAYFEISKQKLKKITEYLSQYLTAHGFKDVRPE